MKRFLTGALAIAIAASSASAFAADPSYATKVYKKQGGDEIVVTNGGRITVEAGGILDLSASSTLGKGIIPIDITAARSLATNDIPNTAASPSGGILTLNTSPLLKRENAATDKALRIQWAAGNAAEIALPPIVYPPDLDDAAVVTVKILAKSAGAADTPVITVGFFEGVGDTNAGGATGAVTAAVSVISVVIAAADVGAAPKSASITLIPGTHATDALDVYAVWVEYTRKTS
jgi:hypothetical protein